MRTSELSSALASRDPGIEITLDSRRATMSTLYEPILHGHGKTLFDAAFDLAKQMIRHPDCPPDVEAALDSYNGRTCVFAL